MNDRGLDAIIAELKTARNAKEIDKEAALIAELKGLFADKDKPIGTERGFDALMADMDAMLESTEKQSEALDVGIFRDKMESYNFTAGEVALKGYKKVLAEIRDTDIEATKPYMTSEEREAVESLNEDELRRLGEQEKDLVNAIEQGMTLQEYLESDSAHSWLDRQQAEGDEA